eukprot:GHRQ01012056.1.p3 GENE.GHRQ01012056.1~~GHRQ01012056.1.p3  ORF type:complete len:131 (-),score=21.21 GHRQ01012056.1:3135-3527(-)
MHELGHNLYLNHAGSFQPVAGGGSQFVAYKDDSGAMGHCCSTRCFNAPHSHQLGWSSAVDTLNKDNFAAGAPKMYVFAGIVQAHFAGTVACTAAASRLALQERPPHMCAGCCSNAVPSRRASSLCRRQRM